MTQPPVTVISVDIRHGQTEIMIVNIIDKLECYPALYYADWIHRTRGVVWDYIGYITSSPLQSQHSHLVWMAEWLIMIESLSWLQLLSCPVTRRWWAEDNTSSGHTFHRHHLTRSRTVSLRSNLGNFMLIMGFKWSSFIFCYRYKLVFWECPGKSGQKH